MAANGRERTISAGAVIALHAGLLWMVLNAHPATPRTEPSTALSTFDVVIPQPSPPDRRIKASPRRAGPSGLAGVEAERSAVVAPMVVDPPPELPPAALAPQQGTTTVSGSATAGSGTGAGDGGSGAGSGGAGSGSGAGLESRARLIAGAITSRDYPKAERAARMSGSVTVAFVVGADGRVRDCAIVETSGSAALDAVTCRLIEARFRYAPARNSRGNAVSERRGWRQRWWLE